MRPRDFARPLAHAAAADSDASPTPSALGTWVMHKFGGTCMADAGRIEHVAGEIERALASAGGGRVAVVVSAMAGTTDALLDACRLAAEGDDAYQEVLAELGARTGEAARRLLGEDAEACHGIVAGVAADLEAIGDVCRGLVVSRECPPSTRDLVAGFGELWSSALLHALFRRRGVAAARLDARDVLVVEPGETGPSVLWSGTAERFGGWMRSRDEPVLVITGFVARDATGRPTTLGRNGSDFTASIFASLLSAGSITIWTDVDGVMSADPRRVPEARLVGALSYDEAMELAYFGASVLHPQTMGPAVAKGIPIHIKNLFTEGVGTTVRRGEPGPGGGSDREAVKGFSLIEDVALLELAGAGLIGVPGVASRMFGALREAGVSVTMISQASSEHSICAAVPAAHRDAARAAVQQAFAAELLGGQVQRVDLSGPYVVLAAVGDGMVHTPGVAARFFRALARAGVNVRAIAQGSSERNISVIVAEEEAERALRAVHAGFYLSDQATSVGLIGPGGVGGTLLDQLAARPDFLVRGIADSRRMLLDDGGIDLGRWRERLAADGVPLDMAAFERHVAASHLAAAAMVDCTASDAVADRYADWLERGLHVVTPNKKAGTRPLADYRRLRALGDRLASQFLYETTVGAGLPVISTLRELIRTGDRVLRIEGVLSGSLSFILQALDGGTPLSEAVRGAWDRGFMEPDPRDDLSGMDVARKAVILGREMGLSIDLADVPVESLVPAELADCDDPQAFLAGLDAYDTAFAERTAGEGVVRHVAVVDAERGASVGLQRYAGDHAFARIRPGDNIIAFTTERYAERPLIVQGPGAGREVTAAGIFGDLLRLVGPGQERHR